MKRWLFGKLFAFAIPDFCRVSLHSKKKALFREQFGFARSVPMPSSFTDSATNLKRNFHETDFVRGWRIARAGELQFATDCFCQFFRFSKKIVVSEKSMRRKRLACLHNDDAQFFRMSLLANATFRLLVSFSNSLTMIGF